MARIISENLSLVQSRDSQCGGEGSLELGLHSFFFRSSVNVPV